MLQSLRNALLNTLPMWEFIVIWESNHAPRLHTPFSGLTTDSATVYESWTLADGIVWLQTRFWRHLSKEGYRAVTWLPGICSRLWRRFPHRKKVADAKQEIKYFMNWPESPKGQEFVSWTVLCSTYACSSMFGSQRVHFADGAEMMIFLLTIVLST